MGRRGGKLLVRLMLFETRKSDSDSAFILFSLARSPIINTPKDMRDWIIHLLFQIFHKKVGKPRMHSLKAIDRRVTAAVCEARRAWCDYVLRMNVRYRCALLPTKSEKESGLDSRVSCRVPRQSVGTIGYLFYDVLFYRRGVLLIFAWHTTPGFMRDRLSQYKGPSKPGFTKLRQEPNNHRVLQFLKKSRSFNRFLRYAHGCSSKT